MTERQKIVSTTAADQTIGEQRTCHILVTYRDMERVEVRHYISLFHMYIWKQPVGTKSDTNDSAVLLTAASVVDSEVPQCSTVGKALSFADTAHLRGLTKVGVS